MRYAVSILCGLLFGAGLTISDMINPSRVLAFLDLGGAWDPSALFVFAGALPVSALSYRLMRGRRSPLFDTQFHVPTLTAIDRKLIGGAVLFGIGWGIAGFCPGPALTAVISGQKDVFLFLAAMFAGMALFRVGTGSRMAEDASRRR